MGSPNREDAVAYEAVINLLDGKPVNWKRFDDRTGSYRFPTAPGGSGNIWDLVNSARLSHPSAVERKMALNVYEESYDSELHGGNWWLNEQGSRVYCGYRLPAQLLARETFVKMRTPQAKRFLDQNTAWFEAHIAHAILASWPTSPCRTGWTGMRSGGSKLDTFSNDLLASLGRGLGVAGFPRYQYTKKNTGRVLYERKVLLKALAAPALDLLRNPPGSPQKADPLFPKARVPYTIIRGSRGALAAQDRNINGNTAPLMVGWATSRGFGCLPPDTGTSSRQKFVHSSVLFSDGYRDVTLSDSRYDAPFRRDLVELLGPDRIVYRRTAERLEILRFGAGKPVTPEPPTGQPPVLPADPRRESRWEEWLEKIEDWWKDITEDDAQSED